MKPKLVYLHFLVCHVVSRLIPPSFSMADSLTVADVLSTARERSKNTFSKVIFNIYISTKTDLKLKTFFCE